MSLGTQKQKPGMLMSTKETAHHDPFHTEILISTPQGTGPFSSAFIGERLQSVGISAQATDIIGHTLRPITRDQYNSMM